MPAPWFAALAMIFTMISNAAADDGGASFHTHTLRYDQSAIAVHIADDVEGVDQEEIVQWVRRAADAVITYYGRYPVAHVDVTVHAAPDGGLGSGRAYGGHRIVMSVGPATRPDDLEADWRMTHEMVHLSFPDLERRHIWMTEGVATYVESIARARAGQVPAEKVWWWMVTGLPKGMPAEGDRGLDHTHTWGRTYWGGALYFFLADMMIRNETNNRRTIDDALRAILDAGGNGGVRWSMERVVTAGDEATGTTIMSDLYDRMAGAPMAPDLEKWFRRLGVSYRNDEIVFNDDAPLTHLRRALTAPPSGKPVSTNIEM